MTKERKLTNEQILLKEAVSNSYKEIGGYPNESTFFEFFSAEQILKNYELDTEQIESGMVGRGGDGGCDTIYLFLNDMLITSDMIDNLPLLRNGELNLTIIQSKEEYSFREDPLMKWKTLATNLLQLSNDLTTFSSRYDASVIAAFQLFRDIQVKFIRTQVKTRFSFFYITFATEIHPNVQAQADELVAQIKQFYPSATTYVNFVTADNLMSLYQQAPETNFTLLLADHPIAMGEKNDYVALVKITDFFTFITDPSKKLRNAFFEANIRDYQGGNSVNKCIQDTLLTNPNEDFWWLNNGVTILARNITQRNSKTIQIEDPKIVNGLQTSSEIFNFFATHPERMDSDKRSLLVRLIVPESEESRDKVIFATNNQTPVQKSSLRVTDAIHLQIEMYFKTRGLYYDRRKNYYKNQGKKPIDIISVSFLGQCMISIFLQKPDYARARPSTILTNDTFYEQLYGENADLEIFYRCAQIGRAVSYYLKEHSDSFTISERSNILFYVIYVVPALILRKTTILPTDIKTLDIDAVNDDTIQESAFLVLELFKARGGTDKIAKNSDFFTAVKTMLDDKIVSDKKSLETTAH